MQLLNYCDSLVVPQARQHDTALQQAQRHAEQQAAAAAAASEAAERYRLQAELLQQQLETMEAAQHDVAARAEDDRASAVDARKQVREGALCWAR